MRQSEAVRSAVSFVIRVFSVIIFLFLWEWAVDKDIRWPLQFGNLPGPVDIVRTWGTYFLQRHYYQDILISVERVTAGILLGFVTAVPLGLWIGLRRTARDALYPSLELFRPIPLIAFLPFTMLLFPTIESSIIFITFIGAFFPILINAKDAVERVSPVLLQAARCLGCGPIKAIWNVFLPAMLPEIFTGLAVGTGASWMGVITGEMMSGQTGIGYTTWQAYHLLDYKQSIIGMFTIGALGLASSVIVRFCERLIVKWK